PGVGTKYTPTLLLAPSAVLGLGGGYPLTTHDPYQALRFGDYRLLLAGSLIASLGSQMLALAVGWELYERTSSALALGIVGLVQVLPVLTLALVAGHVADR